MENNVNIGGRPVSNSGAAGAVEAVFRTPLRHNIFHIGKRGYRPLKLC